MDTEQVKIKILIINNDFSETENIKSWLDKDMRVPWTMVHCINVQEARPRVNKVDLVILKPEMEGIATPKEVFKDIEHMVFETPIIVLTDDNHDQNGLSTYVMEKGAADILIRGQFARLVDAIEFALIRQKITTDTRKISDKTLQTNKNEAEKKLKISYAHRAMDAEEAAEKLESVRDLRKKDQEESKNTLSIFMGGYSASDHDSKDKKETK